VMGLLFLLQGPTVDNGDTRLPRRMHHSGPQHIKHKKEGKHNEAFDHAGFDPEVAHHAGEYEEYYNPYGNEEWRGGEDDEWWDEHYAQNSGGFNISHRIEVVFPLIDLNGDGKVSVAEMEAWHVEVGLNSSLQRAEHEFTATDRDGDGKVTLEEYLGEDNELVKILDQAKGDMKMARELAGDNHYSLNWVQSTLGTFRLADADGDGALDSGEFFHFLHPEESGDAKFVAHLMSGAMAERDGDDDHRLSMEEFENGLWHELKPWNPSKYDSYGFHDYESFHEEEEDPEKAAMEHDEMRKRFNGLDANGDGHIDVEELRAELHSLHPSEAVFAQRQAAHLVEQADEDKDLHLTLDEMLANPYVFYSAALTDEMEYYHDEFK